MSTVTTIEIDPATGRRHLVETDVETGERVVDRPIPMVVEPVAEQTDEQETAEG